MLEPSQAPIPSPTSGWVGVGSFFAAHGALKQTPPLPSPKSGGEKKGETRPDGAGSKVPLPHRHRYRRDLHRHRRRRYRHRHDAGDQGREHPVEPGRRPGARGQCDPRSGGRDRPGGREPRPRHHRRHQCAAAGPDQLARTDRHRGLPAHSRDCPPVGARGLRQFLLLGEARPPGAAALRARGRRPPELQGRGPAPAGRGERALRGTILPPPRRARHRRLADPFLCQSRPRAARRRNRRAGIPAGRAFLVLHRAPRISRIRAHRDHPRRRLRQAAHGTLPRARP